jgi:4-oxalmesaconate hydratase
MVGAVRGIDPRTGHYYDDTRRYIEAARLDEEARTAVFEGNVRRVYPRLAGALQALGS